MRISIKNILTFLMLCGVVMVCGCNYNKRSYDTLYLRLKEDISSVDPAFIVDVDGSKIAAYLYDGLVRLDKNLQIISDIAQRWEIYDGGKRYRFFLRNDVKFTNGLPCTALQVKKSFMRILDPNVRSPRSWIFELVEGGNEFMHGCVDDVKGFFIVDTYVFDIILNKPFSPFLSMLTMPNASVVLLDNQSSYPVGTGPYKIEHWERGDSLTLQRVHEYFAGKPHIEHIVFRIIPEEFTAITEFETGMLDVLEIPTAEFEYFMKHPVWREHIYSTELLNTYYLGFNCEKEPCSNQLFRKAVSTAIDSRSIIEKFFSNRMKYAISPIPPSLLAPYGITVKDVQQYNPKFAKQLLNESNINLQQTVVKLSFNTNMEMQAVAEFIQHDLSEIGIKVELEALEWTTFKEKVSKGQTDLFLLSWWADYPDIENFLYPVFDSVNWGSAGNRARYKNSQFDRTVELARVSTNREEQIKLYKKALDIVLNDSPWRVLWHKKKFIVCQSWVKGFFLPSISNGDKGLDTKLIKKE